MLHALDENQLKIKPKKGKSAICPYCFGKVNAVCGDINIHHWRHDVSSNCDPWKEHETEWHRSWKEHFPEEWREVIIENAEERHIADLLTVHGLVVEFQNSSISNKTIQIREQFYNKMIWLINADHFKDNFSIRSVVNTKLRNLEESYSSLYTNENDIEEQLSEKITEIEEFEWELNGYNSQLKSIQENIEDYCKKLKNLDEAVGEILNDFYYGHFNEFKSDQINIIRRRRNKVVDNDTKVNTINTKIRNLEQLPDSLINGVEKLKIVKFSQVLPKNYNKCKVVKTSSINTFFPVLEDVNSEGDFRWYSTKDKEYTLLIDIADSIKNFNEEIKKLKNNNAKLKIENDNSFLTLKGEMKVWFESKIKKENESLKNIENDISRIEGEIFVLTEDMKVERSRLNEEATEYALELSKSKKSREIEIKRNCKGLYSYYWKHRRKSWDYAECPLFLDFGNYIFEIISDNQFKKITHQEFINKIKNDFA